MGFIMRTGRPLSERYKAGDRVESKKYGWFVVVAVKSATEILCRSEPTGYEIWKQAAHLDSGSIRDPYYPVILGVGCHGEGKYTSRSHGVMYQKWRGMMTRCYDHVYQNKNPTYVGCTVCNDWLNFQNFAKWAESVGFIGQAGLELDKDIRSKGEKLYGPETCSFVTSLENNEKAHCREVFLLSPEGIKQSVLNVSEFCRNKGLSQAHISSVLNGKRKQHKGWRAYAANP